MNRIKKISTDSTIMSKIKKIVSLGRSTIKLIKKIMQSTNKIDKVVTGFEQSATTKMKMNFLKYLIAP